MTLHMRIILDRNVFLHVPTTCRVQLSSEP